MKRKEIVCLKAHKRKTNCGGRLAWWRFFAPTKFALFCTLFYFIIFFFTAQGKQMKGGGLLNFKACSVYARKGLLQVVFSEDNMQVSQWEALITPRIKHSKFVSFTFIENCLHWYWERQECILSAVITDVSRLHTLSSFFNLEEEEDRANRCDPILRAIPELCNGCSRHEEDLCCYHCLQFDWSTVPLKCTVITLSREESLISRGESSPDSREACFVPRVEIHVSRYWSVQKP